MWTTEPEGKDGPGRRQAGRFVQSGRTAFFPVPVLRTSTSGRTVSFVSVPVIHFVVLQLQLRTSNSLAVTLYYYQHEDLAAAPRSRVDRSRDFYLRTYIATTWDALDF